MYGIEAILPIECEIPSLNLAMEIFPNTSIEEENFLYLAHFDEYNRDALLVNETNNKCIKE